MLGCLAGNVAWNRGTVTEWEWEGGEEEEEQVRQPLMAKGRSRRWPGPSRGGGCWGWAAPSPPPCSCSCCPFSPSPHGRQSAMALRSQKICTVAVTLCFTPTGWSSFLLRKSMVWEKYAVSPQTLFLACFRCFLKDVPVLVSSPLNSIPDFVIPSHVVVPRCQGLCLGSLGAFFLFFCLLWPPFQALTALQSERRWRSIKLWFMSTQLPTAQLYSWSITGGPAGDSYMLSVSKCVSSGYNCVKCVSCWYNCQICQQSI